MRGGEAMLWWRRGWLGGAGTTGLWVHADADAAAEHNT
jgi:hypothetical protein